MIGAMCRALGSTGLAVALAARVLAAQAFDTGWPRQVNGAQASIVVYEPQPDSLVGEVLYGRAAVQPPAPRPAPTDLDRAVASRDRGDTRAQRAPSGRPAPSPRA